MSIFGNKSIVVRWVFAEDLNSELSLIKAAILRYSFSNVDALQIIQLSLSLSDAQGNLLDFDSPFSYIWEFNFRDFDINQDYYASDTVELLKRQVVDFEKNKEKGIDSKDFAKKLWDYGLVFNCYDLKSITWITFHQIYAKDSYSNYNIFSLKRTFKFLGLLGGLDKIAQTLNVAHITGSSYQAGLNSLLTLQYFMKLKSENIFESKWNKTN
ncbi:hypothetical protein ES319_D02G226700v1 [Gossypium barbadense]|uniref:Uncharacterized protein n=2 Tax=Gossypium TaxID=3633 RepID=A0A5J5SL43_GOSBA|nr:hypothetical protein ES319_D02G226700v1 [Gossypium barbadense]TYG80780.1 hypothetical protein ES288_D02G243200v1 [Gossypium darwinii]